jgi:molybdopterin-guanine dinucleotide biosynthesis protein A
VSDPTVGVLILGGGEASRLPGKLELTAGELPMLARVYRNIARDETWIAGKASFSKALDAFVPAPVAIDRWSLRGPLAGLLTTMARMRARWVFALAGDAPLVESGFIDQLAALREPGDEAIVPVHEREGKTQLEPLAALYDRLAFLREGFPVLRSGGGALRKVLDRMRTRLVPIEDPRIFTNVNTPADYAALRALLDQEPR